MTETFTAARTDQAGLQRTGYVLQDRDSGVLIADMRERSYTFDGLSGLSATLTDKEFPANALGKRELVFEVSLSVKDGGSANDLAAITPQLVAATQRAMSQSAAIVAGLGYLATPAASSVTPEALQATVIDYVQKYRQPNHSPREACLGCRHAVRIQRWVLRRAWNLCPAEGARDRVDDRRNTPLSQRRERI